MMKKLAATVFVLSLAAFGCGSDSGNQKKDAAPKLDVVGAETQVTPDVPIQPDAPVKTDLPVDLPITPDMAPDEAPAVDVAPQVDVEDQVDAEEMVDTESIDTTTIPPVDGGAVDAEEPDSGQAVDGGAAVDAESVG